MSILFYGALSNFGLYMSDRLLNEGNQILGLSSAVTNEEDEIEFTNDLYLGRNSNFQFQDYINEYPLSSLNDINQCLFIDGYFYKRSSFSPTHINKISETMKCIRNDCSNIEKLIIISSTEIYGSVSGVIKEDTLVTPKSDEGHYFVNLEHITKQVFSNEEIQVCILRIPLLHGDQSFNYQIKQRVINGDSFVMYQDVLHYKDAIEGIVKMLEVDVNPGIHYLQLTSGLNNAFLKLDFSHTNGEIMEKESIIYSNRKAKRILGFEPKILL